MSGLVASYEADKRAKRSPKQRAALERRYAKARVALERAEARMARAFTAWQKLRASVRRYERELDREALE